MTDRPEHTIRCPWCRAAPGNRCTRPSGKPLSIPSHDARIQAWQTAQEQKTGDTA